MRYAGRFLRPAVKQVGGQSKMARWIVGHLPHHEVYCEPFAGGLSVLLNKPRVAVEWVGDTNPELISFYEVISDVKLRQRFLVGLNRIGYSEAVFRRAVSLRPSGDKVADALLFYVVRRMSRNGDGRSFSRTGNGRLRGGRDGDINAWETMKTMLPLIGERLGGVGRFHGPAMELLERVSRQYPDGVYYIDPPWCPDCRVSKDLYGEHEMSLEQHEVLLEFLLRVPARGVYVSSGPSALYQRVLGGAGWDCDRRVAENNMATGFEKSKKLALLYFRH